MELAARYGKYPQAGQPDSVYFLPHGVPLGLPAFPWWHLITSSARKDPAGRGPRYKNGHNGHGRPRTKPTRHLLNHVRKAKIPLTIFLVNGVKLQGVVTWFDNFCVLLRRDGHSQLVYKHAISTIMPGHPVQLFEGAEDVPAGEKV